MSTPTPTGDIKPLTFRRYKDDDAKPLPWQEEIFDGEHSHKCLFLNLKTHAFKGCNVMEIVINTLGLSFNPNSIKYYALVKVEICLFNTNI